MYEPQNRAVQIIANNKLYDPIFDSSDDKSPDKNGVKRIFPLLLIVRLVFGIRVILEPLPLPKLLNLLINQDSIQESLRECALYST